MLKNSVSKKQAIDKPETLPAKVEPKLTFIQKVLKGETFLVMAQSAIELEDEFSALYFTQQDQSNLFLMPPFDPNVLLNLTQTNNILLQCVEAMEVNIDGTGHEFIPAKEGVKVDEAEKQAAEEFFNEPYPNMSFVAMRRKLRRQLESVGYAYLEVLRTADGKIIGLRNIETSHVRMVKLDKPVQVKKKITRNGKEIEITMWERERRFAQQVALKNLVYYREYGTTRHIDRDTGNWETDEYKVPLEKRGSELLMFGVHPDTKTPYFVPRWINQLPSVVGSRSAEEQNLEFLDAGGMPPAIIFLQGGALVKESSDQLKAYLSGKNKNKNRACVVEVMSTGGSLDSNSKVDVKTERFGSEASKDAMFMNYDENTEEHVRQGFRLPPLFLGKAADYNFATAQTSYMVAEAQVFLPERTDFDEILNKTIIKEMNWKTLKFKSKPITLKDVATQLKALELSAQTASRESWLKEVNTAAGTSLELGVVPHENVPEGATPHGPTISETPHEKLPVGMATSPIPSPQPEEKEPGPSPKQVARDEKLADLEVEEKQQRVINLKEARKKKTAIEIIDLAHDYAILKGLVRKQELTPERELLVLEAVQNLSPTDAEALNRLMVNYAYPGSDLPDLALIASHA